MDKKEARFTLEEIRELFHSMIQIPPLVSICTDSRQVTKDQIFLPLVGEKFDGHDFINGIFEKYNVEALHATPLLAFCQKDKIAKIKNEYKKNLILVDNTLDAYHKIANYYRKKINPKVVAITGSSGKTTTKELIASVLSAKYKVYKTQENYNNEFGIPKTILEMPEDTDILVLEMAMRAKGEIKYLSKTAEPDVAVITNVGSAHIGRLGSIQGIIEAKCEILEHLKKDGLAVLNNNPALVSHARKIWQGDLKAFDLSTAKEVKFSEGKSMFTLPQEERYFISALGNIHVLNSACAHIVAKHLNLSTQEIQSGFSDFQIPKGRGQVIRIGDDIYLVDESYNANPDSVKEAILTLSNCWDKKYKKILVLGELAELGEHEDKLLQELAGFIKSKNLSHVITVGSKLKQFLYAENVENVSSCCNILKGLLVPGSVVLIKGSHMAGLEEVAESLKKGEICCG